MKEDDFDPLDIDVARASPDVWRVTAVGELARGTSESFSETVVELVDRGASRIVVDLSGVSFIDSSGVNAVVVTQETVAAAGASVIFAAPPEHTRRLFDLLRLSDVVSIEESLDDALEGALAADDESS